MNKKAPEFSFEYNIIIVVPCRNPRKLPALLAMQLCKYFMKLLRVIISKGYNFLCMPSSVYLAE